MKQTRSQKLTALILAAVMLASSLVSCGEGTAKETEKTTETVKITETNAPDTDSPNTQAIETDAPEIPSLPSLITENGLAKAHIVLFDGASAREKKAAEELVYHVKLVSGADITVTNTVQDDSLPIIIATPDTLPELETMFPEDLAWLRVTKEEKEDGGYKRWGSDGFSIRQKDGKIYIFGATAEGALNGVYDFIEENLDVIWVGSDEAGIIYDATPTLNVIKADYREKSPFQIRMRAGNVILCERNKYNTVARPIGGEHNIKGLLTSSPTYDPNETEYWENYKDGTAMNASSSRQVNYWSKKTAQVIVDSVIAKLDAYSDADRPTFFTVSMEDLGFVSGVYPQMNEPFEYAPGQFVEPQNERYQSTVYFSFINYVAKGVAEKYPDVVINTLAYSFSVMPPLCELEENIMLWFCPYDEDYTQDSFAVAIAEGEAGINSTDPAVLQAQWYEEWCEKFPDNGILIYNYYFIHKGAGWYERPFWYRLQNDMQYYAETGAYGTTTCGAFDDLGQNNYGWTEASHNGYPADSIYHFTSAEAYSMNMLMVWLFLKLGWDPYEDVDALIEKFCDKVYGDAADEMKEYYDILYKGWSYSATEILPSEFNAKIKLHLSQEYYFNYFLDIETEDGVYILDALKDAITRAYEAADDKAKEFIRWTYEVYQDWERFL